MCIGIKNEELPEFIATLAISKGINYELYRNYRWACDLSHNRSFSSDRHQGRILSRNQVLVDVPDRRYCLRGDIIDGQQPDSFHHSWRHGILFILEHP